MEVEELQAILEAKDGMMEEQEEEIIYAEEEETEQGVEEHAEEIVEIIEEIVVVEGEDGDENEEEESSRLESVTEGAEADSMVSQEEDSPDEEIQVQKSGEKRKSQRITTYDAKEDWEEENDPLETKEATKSKRSNTTSKRSTVNGNKVVSNGNGEDQSHETSKTRCSGEYEREMKIPRHDDEDSPHEIVKNAENDLVYTVLGSKKQSQEEKNSNARYIKMERLEENTIPVEGTIYYEGDDMGTLYVAHPMNENEQYELEGEPTAEQEEQQLEQPEQWDGSNEIIMAEQGEEESAQDQIFLHEDEDGQLFFKDENGQMQPVYLTEDGNYAIASNSSDEQENQEERNKKTHENVEDLETLSNRQSPSPTPTNNDPENEDNTVTISLIISEDENGLKRTQVIIPTTDALKCEICQKSFKTQFQLLRHNRLKHAREEDITVRNFPCDLCPKRFPDQNSLAKHRKTHTGDRPFQCLECHEQFPTANSLRRHMNQHNPDSKPLPCIYCGRRFIDKPTLQKHEQSHLAAEQRTHTCDICHKPFISATDLSMHKKNHDPDKKFDCEVCGREFNRLNNLQRHMLVHQQVRDKAASSRGESFEKNQQGQNQEILSCDVCGITYKFMSSLTRHMVTSHMNPEKLRQQAEEQRRKRENNYKRYLENRKMYETQHVPIYGKRLYRTAVSSDPDDDLA
ncbi:zinc finger and BTB domain-containing protein 17 isoform X2 [Diachasma alloeum]|uniref:zinc finger and BTB domain-containing protein 17 isoform X2 n=1 Tax=Diachasma alloeum TaxID=454923 RepID=UPI0007383499|nr:zinc finger and BTB domain-containing protein 17 isoform X2 [Diachasma alloeum]